MHKFFSFKGITRSTDNLIAGEGESLELMNLRSCNGSLKPVPEPKSVSLLSTSYSLILWHGIAGYYICVTDDSRHTLHFYDKEWNSLLDGNGEQLFFRELSDVVSVETIGNIVCCMTEKGIKYIIYSEGHYRWLGEHPSVPEINISVGSKLQMITTEESYTANTVSEDFESSWRYNKKGFIDECIYYLNLEGYYIDRALFRFALRLYDGSYIFCSHVIYVSDDSILENIGRDSNNFYSKNNEQTDTYSTYTVKVKGFKPTIEFSGLNLDMWKGIVVGIDLFTTGSIMGHKVDTLIAKLHNGDTFVRVKKSFEGYVTKSIDELWNDISSSYLFYKVAEYDIEGNCTFWLKDVSPTNLQLQQSLNSALLPPSLSSLAAKCSYTFNKRLHIASLRELLFGGYNVSSIIAVGEGKKNIESIAVETKIRTNDGIAVVVENYGSVGLTFRNGVFELPPLLSYPDSRAFEMNIYVSLDTELFVKSFKLKPHEYLNQAQYLHQSVSSLVVTTESVFASGFVAAEADDSEILRLFSYEPGIHEVIYSESEECWKYKGVDFPPDEFSNMRVFTVPRDVTDGDKIVFTITSGQGAASTADICNIPIDSTWKLIGGSMPQSKRVFEERPSVLKVSSADNPFVFPAKCTYTPSQTRIIAMASNTMELSQGRFGEHPLFVFCEDGIWTMSLDVSGRVAYTGCYPFSREVCCNAKSVCGVDSGVVFVGRKGVMLISGNRVVELSSNLLPENTMLKIYSENIFFTALASLVSLECNISVTDFNEYISECKIAYDARHSEIVLSNGTCESSYIYSLKDGIWSRISCQVSGFVSFCSSFTMFQSFANTTRLLSQGDELSGSNRILLITRPMSWGTKLFKRVSQFMLHAYASLPAKMVPDKPVLACYLLCSNDGWHFKAVAGREFKGEVQDVRFPYFPTQGDKYYIFAIAGNLGVSSLFTGIEADVSVVWNNRIQ